MASAGAAGGTGARKADEGGEKSAGSVVVPGTGMAGCSGVASTGRWHPGQTVANELSAVPQYAHCRRPEPRVKRAGVALTGSALPQ